MYFQVMTIALETVKLHLDTECHKKIDNQVNITQLKNVRKFKVKRAHVLYRMCAHFS